MISPATFFNRRWRWATAAVVLGMLFLARLGVWQLDRLEWRRGLNAARAAELARAPLALDGDLAGLDLTGMAGRQATAAGVYDVDRQFVVESQVYNGRPGQYLVTPLLLAGREEAVLVNRGWIPAGSAEIAAFDPPAGEVTIEGYLQVGETLSGGRATEISPDRRLYRVDVAAMGERLPYDILPVYFLLRPGPQPAGDYPQPIEPDLSLDEGNHFSYAIQWFSFAALLALIYVIYVIRHQTP